MFYGLRKFGRFIKRLWRWVPVLWKQEDWDYDFLYEIMRIKMEELLKCLKEDNIHVGADRRARQLSICLEYFKRMRTPEDYIDIPSEDVSFKDTSDGFVEMKTTPYFNRQCKKCREFEKFNYDMFWKRFVQWHTEWWV